MSLDETCLKTVSSDLMTPTKIETNIDVFRPCMEHGLAPLHVGVIVAQFDRLPFKSRRNSPRISLTSIFRDVNTRFQYCIPNRWKTSYIYVLPCPFMKIPSSFLVKFISRHRFVSSRSLISKKLTNLCQTAALNSRHIIKMSLI